jgi:flagellar hook-associated protein 1 FlgK
MSDAGLWIAATALDAQQTGMDAVAQDLANVNTPNYLRVEPELAALEGTADVGGGVGVLGVRQVINALVQSASYAADALSQSATAYSQVLSTAEAYFPEPGTSGMQSELSSFWSAWDQVANDATALAPRQQLLSVATQLVTSIAETYQNLTELQSQTVGLVSSALAEVNGALAQVAQLNQAILLAKGSGGDVNALVDQINQQVQTLANDIGATATQQSDGTFTVHLGGYTLVQGNQVVDTLSAVTTGTQSGPAPNFAVQVVSKLTGGTVPVLSGKVAGLAQAISQIDAFLGQAIPSGPPPSPGQPAPGTFTGLNGMAAQLATVVNGQLSAGGWWNGSTLVTPGPPMFLNAQTGGATGIDASNIEVSPALVANPMQIAASSATATGANDGTNAQVLAQDFDISGGPDQIYQALVAQVGSTVKAAATAQSGAQAAAQSADANEQEVSGVDPNEEEIQMTAYQQAYEAAAKVVTAVSTAIDSLIAAV